MLPTYVSAYELVLGRTTGAARLLLLSRMMSCLYLPSHRGHQFVGVTSISIWEKTTTLIFLDLQLVHHFINRNWYLFWYNCSTSVILSTATCSTLLFQVKVMLWLTVSQSVCFGVKFTLELVTRYYFLSESCCVVSVGRPLWREVGSLSCQSLSSVFSPLSKI
jgi:hypothetical protein